MRGARTRGALTGERGFTLVEVVVSTLLLSIGVVALITVLDSSRDLVSLSEKRETALHQAELEMERVRAVGFESLALPTAPATSSNPNDPRFFVQAGSPARYRWNHLSAGVYDPLVVDSTTCAGTPTPCLELQTNFQDGRLTGTIHRFATWIDDNGDGTNDLKRITVAVTLNQGTPRPPVTLSTIIRKSS